MNRLHSYAAGMLSVAAIAPLAGVHIHAAMFALGFAAAVLLGAACLSSPRTRRGVARWIASADRARSGDARSVSAGRAKSSDTVPQPPDPRERELTSALLNLGSRKAPATAAARYAIANSSPAADIPELLRIALRAPQVAA